MRVDVLEPLGSQYRVLHHFSRKLFEALERSGVDCRYIPAEKGAIHMKWNDLPSCTIGFNGVPCAGSNREMLCDQTATPHLAILVDPPTWHYPLTTSPFMILSCDDRSGNRLLSKMPFDRHFFLPHAVEKEISYDPQAERDYPVTLLATHIDHETRRNHWRQLFPSQVCDAMDDAITLAFEQADKGFIEAFEETLLHHVPTAKDTHLPTDPNFIMLCCEIELYIKGKERLDLVSAIKNTPVHIFGAGLDGNDWKQRLANHKNIHFHPPVSFDEAFEVMQRTKILLNCSLKNKEGAHERIFMGLGSGAAVATHDCPFMHEQFDADEELILFDPTAMDRLDERLSELLAVPKKLEALAQAGRQRTLNAHTWDHRVETILEELPLILDGMIKTR